jgi:hypothetical protein
VTDDSNDQQREELLRLRQENLRLREERLAAQDCGSPSRTIPPIVNVKQINQGCLSGFGTLFALAVAACFLVSQCGGH